MTGTYPAELLVRAGIWVLPTFEARARYRAELAAELADLPPARRLWHALSFAAGAPALRRAVRGADHPLPLHCACHLHRYRVTTNADGERYRRCVDCGHDDPRLAQPRNDVAWVGYVSR